MTDERTMLLRIGMDTLVPIWIAEMDHWPPADRQHAAVAAADLIACGADEIWNASPRGRDVPRGKVATALAQGVAALAYGPAGADWAGGHWCVASHQGCPLRVGAGAGAVQ